MASWFARLGDAIGRDVGARAAEKAVREYLAEHQRAYDLGYSRGMEAGMKLVDEALRLSREYGPDAVLDALRALRVEGAAGGGADG